MIGELWAVNHGGEHRFDAEDLEFLSRLGNFVRAAHRLLSSMNEVNEARRILATGPRRNVGSARWDAASPSAQSVEYQELRDSINEAYCASEVAFDVRSEVDDYVILDVNPAFERVTGMEEAVGSKLSEVDFREDHRGLAVYRQIARTGRPQHFDMPAAFSRVFSGYAFRIGEPRQHCVVVPFKDMMDRARLEHALRASEAQQAFLRRFGGTLRPLSDLVGIQAEAARARRLPRRGLHLLCRVQSADRAPLSRRDYVRSETGGVTAAFPAATWSMVFERLRQGQPVVEENVLASGATPEEERAALTAIDIRSYIAIPLAKQNRLIGAVTICHAQPRRWQSDEV